MTLTTTRQGAALLVAATLAAMLTTVAAPEPAEAITFNHGACSVQANNGYYSYYQASTSSSDFDCKKVGVAFHVSPFSYDSSYPYFIDRVSATPPAGTQTWHYLKNSVSGTTRYISYTW